MNLRKLAIKITAIALTWVPIAVAQAGGSDRGGGDPRAAEFLDAAKTVCRWMDQNKDLKQYAEKCESERLDLEKSLNDKSRVPRISSTFDDVKDHGVQKDAVADGKAKTVEIQIDRWKAESLLEHQITAAMEMSILIPIADRYDVGQMVFGDAGSPMLGFFGTSPVRSEQSSLPEAPRQGTVICAVESESPIRPTVVYLNDANQFWYSDTINVGHPGITERNFQVVLAMSGNLDIMVRTPKNSVVRVKGIKVSPALAPFSTWPAMANKVFEIEELKIYCAIGS